MACELGLQNLVFLQEMLYKALLERERRVPPFPTEFQVPQGRPRSAVQGTAGLHCKNATRYILRAVKTPTPTTLT